jgi:DNA-directed RNA polymerase subunit E'
MYKLLKVKDTVRVPPKRFNEKLEDVIRSELENLITGKIDKNLGIILAVIDVEGISEGKIIMGDGAIYYDANFNMLVYKPVLNEVIEGTVTEIVEFGAFVNFGPLDGLIHVSQITEDFMSYDQKNGILVGKETKKVLRAGDRVRARVVAVSLKSRFGESKIGLTMRQPYLGKIEWLEEEKRKGEKREEVEREKRKKGKKKGGARGTEKEVGKDKEKKKTK